MKVKQLLTEGYLAFTVPAQAREELAKRFPPKFPEFIGHHITYEFGVPTHFKVPEGTATIKVIGYAEEDGLEALVCTVEGRDLRSDGRRFHITWSLDRAKGKKPVMSNDLISRTGFSPVEPFTFTSKMALL